MVNDYQRALSALNSLNPSCSRDDWVTIGMAAKDAGLSFDDFHNWSLSASNYKDEKDCRTVWDSFKPGGGITAATLFKFARDKGWCYLEERISVGSSKIKPITKEMTVEKPQSVVSNEWAEEVWRRCLPVDKSHSYIARKGGSPDGLRYYPDNAIELVIAGVNVAGCLALPCFDGDNIQTIQFIPLSGGQKLNLPGASFGNGYFVVGGIKDKAYTCEGIGQAWAINQVTGCAAIVCFGAGNMRRIAKVVCEQYPDITLVIIPDRGQEEQTRKISAELGVNWVQLPQDKPKNYDINDYLQEAGENTVRQLLSATVNEVLEIPELPLDVVFANEISEHFEPPDEIVEGLLTAGDGSILYGDSNSGKTFFVIDMVCATTQGIEWMGRQTEKGLVVYLAVESPASVKRRVQTYQKYHDVSIGNLVIVQSPVDLFDGDADANKIIQLVKIIEKQRGEKVLLIVGDTLARLSAGANENTGQDMGVVVKHFDLIRAECSAHFMLIHHSGKNAAAGARGWSGVRAAVDTEIEVTDTSAGHCAEITKQRDLSSKGERIGFQLKVINVGVTKWGKPATSCVVMPADAPVKKVNKRTSGIAKLVLEYIACNKGKVKKAEIVSHLDGKHDSSSVYRKIQDLVDDKSLVDSDGYVSLVPKGAD